MGLGAFTGYRFNFGKQLGTTLGVMGSFSFPQTNEPEPLSNTAFFQMGFGPQIGFIWNDQIEALIFYQPFTSLSQTLAQKQIIGTGHLTQVKYHGFSWGGGTKVYLTRSHTASAQIGLNFIYAMEIYSNSRFSDQTSFSQTTDLTGLSYQIGLFFGI